MYLANRKLIEFDQVAFKAFVNKRTQFHIAELEYAFDVDIEKFRLRILRQAFKIPNFG